MTTGNAPSQAHLQGLQLNPVRRHNKRKVRPNFQLPVQKPGNKITVRYNIFPAVGMVTQYPETILFDQLQKAFDGGFIQVVGCTGWVIPGAGKLLF